MNPKTSYTHLILALATLIITGCTNLPEPLPKSDAPEYWSTEALSESPQANWISALNDPTLLNLINEALSNNFSLTAAAYQIDATKAAKRISKSLRLPNLNAGITSGKQKLRTAALGYKKATTLNSNSLALSSQWEIDLWNRLGHSSKAAGAEYKATLHDYEALKLSLSGQVAKAWYAYTEATQQYELAEKTVASYEANLNVLEKRYERGLSDSFELRLTRAQAASSRALLQTRNTQQSNAARRLEVLLGRYPNSLLTPAPQLPQIPDSIPAGLPADLLNRRHDIQAAQNRLKAKLLLNQSTQRNWLPHIVLTGSTGTTSDALHDLLDTHFDVWSLFGDITAPLFQAGRLKAERTQSKALTNAQITRYKETVLSAFQEVESLLTADQNLRKQEKQIQIAAHENQKAEQQSLQLYGRGLIDITALLDTQRRSFDAQSQYISAQNQRIQNRINLHIALGGNFQSN